MADPPPITVEELVKKAGLPSQCLGEEFREEHIHILAKFCDPWENIGYHLKLTQGDINVIEGDNATTEKKRIATLRKWKEKFAHKATYHVLIEALIQSDHAQQGLNLCRKLNLCLCRELKVEILVDEQLAANLDQKSSDSSQPLTEQSRAGSQNIPSEVVPDTNMCIAQSIHELQMRFVCIQNRFLQSGAGTGVTLQQLQTCISTLPSFTTDTPQKLLEATSVQLFIYNLKEYCCALNPDILEGLIEVLGDRDTKLMMKQYNQDLHNFRCKTKLKDFIGNYDGPAPPGYKEIKLKLGDNWEEKTLADATLICSQISRRSWLVKMISKHSVHVTLLTPRVDDIEIGLHLGDYLRSQRVLQILVCGVCIFDVKGLFIDDTDGGTRQLEKSLQQEYDILIDAFFNELKSRKIQDEIVGHLREFPKHQELKTIEDVKEFVTRRSSFYDYELLKYLITCICAKGEILRLKLQEYEKKFDIYAQCPIDECTIKGSHPVDTSQTSLHVQLSYNRSELTLHRIKELKQKLSSVLQIPGYTYQLIAVNDCTLVFSVPSSIKPISSERFDQVEFKKIRF